MYMMNHQCLIVYGSFGSGSQVPHAFGKVFTVSYIFHNPALVDSSYDYVMQGPEHPIELVAASFASCVKLFKAIYHI
jgi:hypothetical protein